MDSEDEQVEQADREMRPWDEVQTSKERGWEARLIRLCHLKPVKYKAIALSHLACAICFKSH